MNFIGEKCIICHNTFSEDDDIVVCEVCGTPYHRECYKVFNKCVNNTLHEKNLFFEPTIKNEQNVSNEESQEVKNSNLINDFTQEDKTAGTKYDKVIDMSKEMLNRLNLNPDEEIKGVSLLEFYLYTKSLGSTKKFHSFNNTDKKGAFNIFALIIPEYYLASKKMYVETIFVFLINLFLQIPLLIQNYNQLYNNQFEHLVNNPTFQLIGNIFIVLWILFRFMVSFGILPRYFNNCVNHIKSIKLHHSKSIYLEKLVQIRESFNFLAIIIVMISNEILKSSLYVLVSLLYNQYL